MKKVNNNKDYTYKAKNIGIGSPGGPHGYSKGQKAPKLASKWVKTGDILL